MERVWEWYKEGGYQWFLQEVWGKLRDRELQLVLKGTQWEQVRYHQGALAVLEEMKVSLDRELEKLRRKYGDED